MSKPVVDLEDDYYGTTYYYVNITDSHETSKIYWLADSNVPIDDFLSPRITNH